MRTSFKRDMNHNYLVVEPEVPMTGEEYQVRMLLMNDIRGLLKCNIKKIDGEISFYYDISSRQSLHHVYEKQYLSAKEIEILLLSLKAALEQISGYLLEADYLLLLPEYIYIDIQTKEAYFCYLPAIREDIGSSVKRLAEFLLHHLDYRSGEAVKAGYEFYHRTDNGNFCLDTIIRSVSKQEKEQISYHEIPVEEEKEEEACFEKKRGRKKGWEKEKIFLLLPVCGLVILWGVTWLLEWQLTQTGGLTCLYLGGWGYFFSLKKENGEKGKEIPYVEEEVLCEEPERKKMEIDVTTILDVADLDILVLNSMEPKTRPNIMLNQEELVIGKAKAFSDAVIPLPGISRMHAKIIKEKDGFYIMDLNSTNGTFLNGEQLQVQEKRLLHPGDEVTFAMCGYYVGTEGL